MWDFLCWIWPLELQWYNKAWKQLHHCIDCKHYVARFSQACYFWNVRRSKTQVTFCLVLNLFLSICTQFYSVLHISQALEKYNTVCCLVVIRFILCQALLLLCWWWRACSLMKLIHAFFVLISWLQLQNKAANLGVMAGLQGHPFGNSRQRSTMDKHIILQKMFGTFFTCTHRVSKCIG